MGESARTFVRLCGGFAVEIDGAEITARLPGGQARSVLAYLIANRDRDFDRAELIDLVWPQQPPKNPQSDLRPILSRLRRALAPAGLEGRERLRLVLPEPVAVDVEEAAWSLGEARDAARSGEWERAGVASGRARELLAGGFLPAHEEEWVEARRRELDDLDLEALELGARSGLVLGGAGIRAAQRASRELVARAPYREAGYRMLMEALAADGNPAEALRVYEELRGVLRDALGTSPGPELKDLHGRLLAGEQPAPPDNGARRRRNEPSPVPPLLPPREPGTLIGRESELDALREAWRRTRDGERALVFLAGEPGIGKTRLASELAVEAHPQGTSLYAACPQETVLPYQPIVEALRHFVYGRALDASDVAELGAGAGELATLIPEIAPADSAGGEARADDPEMRRYLMFEAIAALVALASRDGPVLLVLDDLHWADPPTLALLRHLIGSPRVTSLMVLGAYRESDLKAGDPLPELLTDLRRERRFERIRLTGLSEDGVGALIALQAGAEAPEPLLQTVREGTNGNPFFVAEVTRYLLESGALFKPGAGWASDLEVEEIGVPEGVQELLASRLSRLSEAARAVLQSAAVLGREFSFEVLRAMVDTGEEALIAAFEEALAARLVVEDERGDATVYAFSHALVRQALYDGLAAPRRQSLHARAARAIEEAEGVSADAGIGALALHYRLADSAGDPAKAIEYSLRAGDRARELLAAEDAAAHWHGAVGLLEREGGDRELRFRLLVGLAELMVAIGDVGRQIGYLERALTLAEEPADSERTAQVQSRLGMAYSLIDSIYAEYLDIARAFERFEAARPVLDRGPVRAARGHLEVGVATAYTYGLRIGDGIETAARAMEIADELGDELLWIGAAETYGWHRLVGGDLAEGLGSIERAFERATERRRPFLAWMGSNIAGQFTWSLGDPGRAQELFERALRLPYIERSAYRRLMADGIGRCHASRGELIAARRMLADAQPSWISHSLEPVIGLWEGRWEEVEALALQVHQTSLRTGNRWDTWAADYIAARVLTLRGESEAAVERLERALEIVVDGGAAYFEVWARPDLARALAAAGRIADARAEVERCREILAGGEDWRGRVGQVEAAEAIVLFHEQTPELANVRFTQALETFEQFSLACDRADALCDWGLALARSGDRPGAVEKLDAAIDAYRSHGAGAALRERAEDARRRLA